ncbi:MAG: M20/M25/M40 family metallo-hydrolase [Candidatus Bathyarchaeia archaeon]
MEKIEPTKLLKQMLETYSPSGKEEKLANLLKDRLTEVGFKNVRLDKAGNLLGELGKGPPTVLLCGHMDTVPGRLPVKIKGGRIFGRGAVDAKASLAAMIIAASELIDQTTEGRIIVAGVVDEEGRGKGIRQILQDGINVDYALFGEPSGVGNITIGYRGRLGVRVLCETEAGHASIPNAFRNAIEKAYGLWQKIGAWTEEKKGPSLYDSVTASLTGIRGGGVSNVTPRRCTLLMDIRLPPSTSCQKTMDQIDALIRQYGQENPEIRIKVAVKDRIEPFVADEDSAPVKALMKAIEETVGVPAKLLRKTGTGDMNLFAEKMRAPVATYGPGNSRLSHTSKEYIEIKEYLTSIQVYRKTVERLLA